MAHMNALAAMGQTIILSVHQPRAAIFEALHKVQYPDPAFTFVYWPAAGPAQGICLAQCTTKLTQRASNSLNSRQTRGTWFGFGPGTHRTGAAGGHSL